MVVVALDTVFTSLHAFCLISLALCRAFNIFRGIISAHHGAMEAVISAPSRVASIEAWVELSRLIIVAAIALTALFLAVLLIFGTFLWAFVASADAAKAVTLFVALSILAVTPAWVIFSHLLHGVVIMATFAFGALDAIAHVEHLLGAVLGPFWAVKGGRVFAAIAHPAVVAFTAVALVVAWHVWLDILSLGGLISISLVFFFLF